MAERRMFTKKITDDDHFLSLSASAQALYLHLSMNADDDGFCNQIGASLFKAHATTEDLKSLLENRYIYQFEKGVIVIKHWRMSNALRKDRYTPTTFKEELEQLSIDENGAYTMTKKERLPNGCQVVAERLPNGCQVVAERLPQDRLGKDSIGYIKDIHCASEKSHDEKIKLNEAEFISLFITLCPSQPKVKELSDGRKKKIKNIIKKYGIDDFKEVLKKVEASDFLSGRDGKWKQCGLDWIINPTNYIKIREGNYDNKTSAKKNTGLGIKEMYKNIITKGEDNGRTKDGNGKSIGISVTDNFKT